MIGTNKLKGAAARCTWLGITSAAGSLCHTRQHCTRLQHASHSLKLQDIGKRVSRTESKCSKCSEPNQRAAFDVSLQSFSRVLIRRSSVNVVRLQASHAHDWKTPH